MKNKMKPSLFKKKQHQALSQKVKVFVLFSVLVFTIALVPIKAARAQMVVTDIPKLIWDKITKVADDLWRKGGALAFQQTLRTALNKMAYDTANYVGSGGQGQKPLFVTQDWGAYMAQVGDEAAGTFLENFASNFADSNTSTAGCSDSYQTCLSKCASRYLGQSGSAEALNCNTACQKTSDSCVAGVGSKSGLTINFCQPSSLEVKVKIGLGLAEQNRPQGPTCTASEMISKWSDAAAKYKDITDPKFLENFATIFDPTASDLGIYWTASTNMSAQKATGSEVAKTKLLGKGGWLDSLSIGGTTKTLPNQAELQVESKYQEFAANFGKTTSDAFVDAANVFLNQLSISAFNNLMQNIGKKSAGSTAVSGTGATNESDPSVSGGEKAIKEVTTKLITPNFGNGSQYDILSELATCPDKNNPGPTNCVIDNKLMQAITEKKTVAEAIASGYLHGDWQLTTESLPGGYESSYSWRNISILREYRILPVSWEAALQKIKNFNDQDPNNKTKATLGDMVSCFDPLDQYTTFSSDFDISNQAWCTGLVDPNWVLKAPLNYCKKEGVSAQILNKNVTPSQAATQYSAYVASDVSVVRAENYCADNQTCIKENSSGGCDAYGYCNEEKRTWSFDGDSCAPVNNTCQAFVNTSSNQKTAYLENTLDYGNCSLENAGCKEYSQTGSYDSVKGVITWNSAQNVYLNKNAENCSSKDEGCSEFIRVKPTWGANLVMNSDFSADALGASSTNAFLNAWPIAAGGAFQASIVDAAVEPGNSGGKALKLSGSNLVSVYSDNTNSLLPDNLDLMAGQSYTLSADVYLVSGNNVKLAIGPTSTNQAVYQTTTSGAWQHASVVGKAENIGQLMFSITASASGQAVFYVKNIKFEMSDWDTGYSSYGASKIYQKLLPPYLESACYETSADGLSYHLKANAPTKCSDYARKCAVEEVGCELYQSAKNNVFSVPAKVSNADYCPSECVGYDVYVSRETYFNSATAENLIPTTAKECNAEAVGCNEFTNLDDVAAGGEQKEYYSALKQCVKPNQATCSSFYSWEGTENGYQLRLSSLKRGSDNGPEVTSSDSALCNATIYNSPVTSPLYNADCREFYNAAGQIFYHLNSRVITCSDDCRAYRITEKNYDSQVTQGQCTGTDRHWDTSAGACNVCINGGTWNSTHQTCVYQGIPGEGKTCTAAESGCREYNGNTGNNVKLISSYDFESNSSVWTSNCTNGISVAAISNNKNGHSLLYNNSASACSAIGSDTHVLAKSSPLIKQIFAGDNMAAQLKVGNGVSEGKSYNVKFLASSVSGAELKLYFYNKDTGEKAAFNGGATVSVAAGGAWQTYSANLDNLDHAVTGTEILAITANGNFYLDNFILTEITDRYYLVKNSSQIPNVCFYDIYDTYQGADYNLGCSAYTDRASVNHNLRSFSGICDQAVVGCEQVISTQNYASAGAGLWGDTNSNGVCDTSEVNCTKVNGDSAMYVIYDKNKQCNQADLGCSLLGQSQLTGTKKVYSDVFKKNNPNKYNTILCGVDGVGCEEWKDVEDGGLSYFRDPGNNVCVYRNSQGQNASQKSWYLAPVKRCDLNSSGQIEGAEKGTAICASAGDCSTGACVIDNNDYPCDVSYLKTIGLGGAGNRIPVPSKQAGLCDIQASTCSEYIDPVSKFNPNLNTTSTPAVKLKPNTLYLLEVKPNSTLTVLLGSPVQPLLADNNYGGAVNTLSVGATTKAILFNSLNNTSITVNPLYANIREAAIGYQLANSLDKGSCNGVADFSNGCILFNERSIVGASGYAKLTGAFDAFATVDKSAPAKCDASITGSCTANQLIKVRPDRICASWLGCTTYATDPATGAKICYSLQQCNSLNDKGECNNFVANAAAPALENATGYSSLSSNSLSQNNIGSMKEVGLNSEAHYDFEEIIPPLSCVRVGGGPCSFDSIVKNLIVREPEKATVDYPVSGKSYLKVPSVYNVYPMSANSWINLTPNQDYYLNYLVNTKNSSKDAKITVEVNGSTMTTQFTVSSPNGWTRKISKFNSGNAGSSNVQVRIRLSSDSSEAGEIYFDDINIEPVLEMGNSQYAARECRLYPTSDSLSCKNQSTNVIKDGLEGYCLEHDKDNPSVCTTWYPADRVSSSVLGRQSLGYAGPTGLSYCTNVDSNIAFAKKITTKLVYNRQLKDGWSLIDGVQSEQCKEVASSYALEYCGDSVNYRAILLDDEVSGHDNWNNYYLYCVPRQAGNPNFLFGVGPETNASSLSFAAGIADTNCAAIKLYDSAWVKYDGKFTTHAVTECSDAAAGQCEPIDESKNADPPIRVYDNNYPAFDESGLKYLAAINGDRSDVFNFTCSNFAQVVAGNGDNKAWTGRTGILASPAYATNTPLFFNDAVPGAANNLKLYGRLRNGAPFGSSVFSDNYDLLNSGPIYLQNQYYLKDNVKVFGGRPYGCTGTACGNIGQCSENPSVMCAFDASSTPGAYNDASYINKKTCSDGGFGVCRPLWISAPAQSTAKNILSTLFLQSYAAFKYQAGSYLPDENGGWIAPAGQNGVAPTVSNVKLKFNGNDTNMTITASGVYSLEFNTNVNPEQQPLKMIYINWGDDSKQAITGQDQRADVTNPHVFYHYYRVNVGDPLILRGNQDPNNNIFVNIWDNWDNKSN
jgi:hypothetical protein